MISYHILMTLDINERDPQTGDVHHIKRTSKIECSGYADAQRMYGFLHETLELADFPHGRDVEIAVTIRPHRNRSINMTLKELDDLLYAVSRERSERAGVAGSSAVASMPPKGVKAV